jgi:uncharacterized membrane protein YfcA
MDVHLSLKIILMLTAITLGFIDAVVLAVVVLLTIPALLANVPPVLALGTNKLQASRRIVPLSIKRVVKPAY